MGESAAETGAGTGVLVRRATPEDVAPMARQLARTFFDDPVLSHIFRSEGRRLPGLRRYFQTQMRADLLPFGGCYTTDGHEGSALWAPAGKPTLTIAQGFVAMRPVLPFVVAHLATTMSLLNLIERIHPREPHWYLASLGVEPKAQGKGIGSSLLQPVLDHCDREGLPAYLESSKARNVPFYRRHGFEVTNELDVPGGGPKFWTMWRPPQPPAIP
jgi:GNAT superfamily N-acetyltransferase